MTNMVLGRTFKTTYIRIGMKLVKKWFILFSILLSSALFAAEDFYQFESFQDKKRFETLTNQLRCLVCQNQNLSESNAPLANDLREKIYSKIQMGQSNQEIIDFMIARYGDFIFVSPSPQSNNIRIVVRPAFLLILASVI